MCSLQFYCVCLWRFCPHPHEEKRVGQSKNKKHKLDFSLTPVTFSSHIIFFFVLKLHTVCVKTMRTVIESMKSRKILFGLIIIDLALLGTFLTEEYGRDKSVFSTDLRTEYTNENIAENIKKVALTFDDGPHPSYTEQLLDGLKERGVIATFFVTGEHAALHPDIIERMYEEGHLIGNHTYSHMQLNSGNVETYKAELIKTNEVLEEIIGEDVLYVRPPYGTWDKSLEAELNMFPVFWSVDPLDWCSTDVAGITEKVINKVEENDIILMHDYFATSVTAALSVVDKLLADGYTFVTVDEILFD